MSVEFFGKSRKNLMKIYELLRAAEYARPRTALLQAAHQYQQTDNPLFFWLLDRGYLEEVQYAEIAGKYTGSKRRVQRNIKGFFRTSTEGAEIRHLFERLFDVIGISEDVRVRFAE